MILFAWQHLISASITWNLHKYVLVRKLFFLPQHSISLSSLRFSVSVFVLFCFYQNILDADIPENKTLTLTRLSSVLSLTKPSSWSLTKERSLLPAVIIVTITSCRMASSGSCDLTFKYSVTIRNNDRLVNFYADMMYSNLLIMLKQLDVSHNHTIYSTCNCLQQTSDPSFSMLNIKQFYNRKYQKNIKGITFTITSSATGNEVKLRWLEYPESKGRGGSEKK